MKRTGGWWHALATGALLLGSMAALTGCTGADTRLTPKEAQTIRGTGQMPPEARRMMAKKMAEAQSRMRQLPANQGAGRPAPGR